MRFLDIAVAAVLGLSSVALLAAWAPFGSDLAASQLREQASARDRLEGLLTDPGLVWLQQAPPGEMCSELASLSNSTVVFTATVGTLRCGGAPPAGAPSANITLDFPAEEVTLVDWLPGAA